MKSIIMERINKLGSTKRITKHYATYMRNRRRNREVRAGNFVYFVVDANTSAMHTYEGVPVVYATREAGAEECIGCDKVISVAEYRRIYGDFVEAV